AVDTALAEHARMHGIGAVSLRYFNVAGAHPGPDGGWLGERHDPETHLIPNILAIALTDGDPGAHVSIYGDDYPTPDGTCVRDYIHVTDLARAHSMALAHLRRGGRSVTFNCGYGHGYSVLEVIEAVKRVSGRNFAVITADRRPGDPVAIVADSTKI